MKNHRYTLPLRSAVLASVCLAALALALPVRGAVTKVASRDELKRFFGNNLANPSWGWFCHIFIPQTLSDGPKLAETKLVPHLAGGIASPDGHRWVVDFNHAEGGEIVVVAAVRTGENGVPASLNLKGKTIRIGGHFNPSPRPGDASLRGAKLLFWLQAKLPPENSTYGERIANYVFETKNSDLLPTFRKEGSKTTVHVTLSSDMRDWRCLSRNRMDSRWSVGSASHYTCAVNQHEFENAVGSVDVSIGLILLLPRAANLWTNYLPGTKLHDLKNDRGHPWPVLPFVFNPTEVLSHSPFVLSEFSIW